MRIRQGIISFLIITFSIFSFRGDFYWLLLRHFEVGWAYVLDKAIPLLIIFAISLFILKKRFCRRALKKFLRNHRWYFLLLGVVVFLVHGGLLKYYFFAEDVSSILRPVNNESIDFPFGSIINGYPFLPFVLSFLLFGTKVKAYNLVSLLLFYLTVLVFYCLVYFLSKQKFLALISSLFFATTPSFLDMFSWQASVQGMSLVLTLTLLSLLFLFFYQRTFNLLYYYLSLLLFLASLQIGFVRVAWLVFLSLFLIWVPQTSRRSFKDNMLISLPYIFIWFNFILLRLAPKVIPGIIRFFLNYNKGIRSSSFGFEYLLGFSYYISHLFLPSDAGRWFLPLIKNVFFRLTSGFIVPQSIIFLLGLGMTAVLLFLSLMSFFRRKRINNWLLFLALLFIFTSLFYVPIFGTVPRKVYLLDAHFIRSTPPYGPGSRYVFSAAVGASLLFAVFVFWLHQRGGLFNLIAKLIFGTVIIMNGFYSIKAHNRIIRGISQPERVLIERFFSKVPLDRKPKLVFSANPQKNPIDNNVAGWRWLHGFYKKEELFYTNKIEEVSYLVKSKKYQRENFYAFYYNPETRAFADITFPARKEFFSPKEVFSTNRVKKNVYFSPSEEESSFIKLKDKKLPFILKRPLLVSEELSQRLIKPQVLKLELEINRVSSLKFPFSDAVIDSQVQGTIKALWRKIPENVPVVAKTENNFSPNILSSSFQGKSIKKISLSERFEIIKILKYRENLRRGMRILVSDKKDKDLRIKETALIDGLFSSEPSPGKDEPFFLAKTTPTIITLHLPYPIKLGRLLLNTPKNLVAEHLPKELIVLATLGRKPYQEIASLKEEIATSWSPNNGKLIDIKLKPIFADSLQIVVKETTGLPVAFDEIIIDEEGALKYSPAQIYELGEKGWWYVDSRAYFDKLLELGKYHTLTLAYACAEDSDWLRQRREQTKLIPGVWKIKMLHFNSKMSHFSQRIQIDCHGSLLRKIILIGPPYPIGIKIGRAILQ